MASPVIAPFISKLYALLNNPQAQELIHWTPAGNGFSVTKAREHEFIDKLLPTLCKSRSMCAFIRQLNGYGFSKSDSKSVTYAHEIFHRDKPELLSTIVRQKTIKRTARAEEKEAEGGEEWDSPEDDVHAAATSVKKQAVAAVATLPSSLTPALVAPPAPAPVVLPPVHATVPVPMPSPRMEAAGGHSPQTLDAVMTNGLSAFCLSSHAQASAPELPSFAMGFMLDSVSTMKTVLTGAAVCGSAGGAPLINEGLRRSLIEFVNRQRNALRPFVPHSAASCTPLDQDATLCTLSSALSDLLILIPTAVTSHGSPRVSDESRSTASVPGAVLSACSGSAGEVCPLAATAPTDVGSFSPWMQDGLDAVSFDFDFDSTTV